MNKILKLLLLMIVFFLSGCATLRDGEGFAREFERTSVFLNMFGYPPR